MVRTPHLLVLLSLFALQAGNLASARVIESCAPSSGPDDKRAIQAARISALSVHARETGSRMVSANESVVDGKYSEKVIGTSTALAARSKVIGSQFKPGKSGPGQVCVSVEVSAD